MELPNKHKTIEEIKHLAHIAVDQMHYPSERMINRGASVMLDEALMSGVNQITDEHSELYILWVSEVGSTVLHYHKPNPQS